MMGNRYLLGYLDTEWIEIIKETENYSETFSKAYFEFILINQEYGKLITLKSKWLERNNKIKCCEPVEGLRIYYTNEDKGVYHTSNVYGTLLSWNMLFKQKEIKSMTREKAIQIAKSFGNTHPWYEDTVRLLEALGLIKFDEPPRKTIYNCGITNSNLDALEKAGYKIVKKDGTEA